jgi:hypothetical protein
MIDAAKSFRNGSSAYAGERTSPVELELIFSFKGKRGLQLAYPVSLQDST